MSHLDEGTLHALLDGELETNEVAEIQAHLGSCSACGLRLREVKEFLAEADRLIASVELGKQPVAAAPQGAAPREAAQARAHRPPGTAGAPRAAHSSAPRRSLRPESRGMSRLRSCSFPTTNRPPSAGCAGGGASGGRRCWWEWSAPGSWACRCGRISLLWPRSPAARPRRNRTRWSARRRRLLGRTRPRPRRSRRPSPSAVVPPRPRASRPPRRPRRPRAGAPSASSRSRSRPSRQRRSPPPHRRRPVRSRRTRRRSIRSLS